MNKEVKEKKPYSAPQLEVYGNITDLTKALARGSGNDNSGNPHAHKVRS